jgi:hypothetical protein
MRVREAEEFFLIEVPDNVRKIVIVKAQVNEVMTYITPPFFFIQVKKGQSERSDATPFLTNKISLNIL